MQFSRSSLCRTAPLNHTWHESCLPLLRDGPGVPPKRCPNLKDRLLRSLRPKAEVPTCTGSLRMVRQGAAPQALPSRPLATFLLQPEREGALGIGQPDPAHGRQREGHSAVAESRPQPASDRGPRWPFPRAGEGAPPAPWGMAEERRHCLGRLSCGWRAIRSGCVWPRPKSRAFLVAGRPRPIVQVV